jgi:hypothetical protein
MVVPIGLQVVSYTGTVGSSNAILEGLRWVLESYTRGVPHLEDEGECTNTRISSLRVKTKRHTHASLHWGWGRNDTHTHLFIEGEGETTHTRISPLRGEGRRTHEYSISGWRWLYKFMSYRLCFFVGMSGAFWCVLVWRCRKKFCVLDYLCV